MDSQRLKLGQIIKDEQQRDCVHVAVAPVVAACDLPPGLHVKIENGEATPGGETIGVVDPYLRKVVEKGQRFWLFLYPGSITSLRHEWTHPAFPVADPTEADKRTEAEAWIRDYLAKSGEDVSYELFIRVCSNGEQYVVHGSDLHLGVSDEAWEKVEIITGRKYDADWRDDTYFSCSC